MGLQKKIFAFTYRIYIPCHNNICAASIHLFNINLLPFFAEVVIKLNTRTTFDTKTNIICPTLKIGKYPQWVEERVRNVLYISFVVLNRTLNLIRCLYDKSRRLSQCFTPLHVSPSGHYQNHASHLLALQSSFSCMLN